MSASELVPIEEVLIRDEPPTELLVFKAGKVVSRPAYLAELATAAPSQKSTSFWDAADTLAIDPAELEALSSRYDDDEAGS